MKRLPDSELELMMSIWKLDRPATRPEIEAGLGEGRQLGATTILSFLSRLEEKGFLKVEKEGKNNVYTALISYEEYSRKESRNILQKMYQNSVKNFVAALYDGESIGTEELKVLRDYIDEKVQE